MNWKRSIPVPAEDQKKMRLTEMKLWRLPTFCSRENRATQPCGTTSLMFL
ncbi:hypothetical protein EVA_14100 [gut metagenome]|uniref:Uncharacterized protein n=1 Tax=gut metagenome TaxID=749906 RepID=J9FTG2_9ZZZZ